MTGIASRVQSNFLAVLFNQLHISLRVDGFVVIELVQIAEDIAGGKAGGVLPVKQCLDRAVVRDAFADWERFPFRELVRFAVSDDEGHLGMVVFDPNV